MMMTCSDGKAAEKFNDRRFQVSTFKVTVTEDPSIGTHVKRQVGGGGVAVGVTGCAATAACGG